MKRLYLFFVVLALLTLGFTGVSILAHEGGKRAELLKKTPDPRTEQEKAKFKERDSIQKLAQIKAELREVKVQMDKEGVYSCCIYRGCNWCALMDADCECRSNLKAGKAVCPECKFGWESGIGAVEGYTAADVKTSLKPMGHKEEKTERRHGRERP